MTPVVFNSYLHDPNAFTQGLVMTGGKLYESTGLYGQSQLREVDLTTGHIVRKVDLPTNYFGEGLTQFGHYLYQLTWQGHLGFIWDPITFRLIGTFPIYGEGWGLTTDGRHLIMSDGTHYLKYLNPETFQIEKRLAIYKSRNGCCESISKINELQWIEGYIWANIFQSSIIVIINPHSGEVINELDLSGLNHRHKRSESMANGIAYDANKQRIYVTGKYWDTIYEIGVKGGHH